LILHDDRENLPTQHTTTETTNQAGKIDADLPLVLQHTCKEPKPSTKLKDSIEYLQQPFTYLVHSNTKVPRTYQEAMKMPNLWLELMSKEIEVLKAKDVFEVVQRPKNKNVVRLKCKKAKLQVGIKPTALCSAIDKENSIESPLDLLHYIYNYYRGYASCLPQSSCPSADFCVICYDCDL